MSDLQKAYVPNRRPSALENFFKGIFQIKIVPAVIACIILFILGGLIKPGYASLLNLGNILGSAAILALASAGQTLCILSGNDGIDLSLGQVMSLTAVLSYRFCNGSDANIPIALLVIIAAGLIIGLINGLGIVLIGLPPLVMTLGMNAVVLGSVFASCAGGSPVGKTAPLLLHIASGRIAGIRYLAILGIVAIFVVEGILRYTKYGRQLYLVGSNRRAAKLSGIDVNKTVIVTYTLSGIFGALAGFFLLGYAGTANLDLGGGYMLLTVAAVIIGGTQLSGGEGTFVGSYVGAVLIVLLTTFLISIGVSQAIRDILMGIVLLMILSMYARSPKLRQ